MTENDLLLTETEAAKLLDIKPKTLNVWRVTRRYPALRFCKIGRNVRYRRSDVLAFIEQSVVGEPTQN